MPSIPGILADGVEALPDEVPIGVDNPNGDIGECTHFHNSKFASTALTYDTHCHSHITVSVLSQLCMFKSPPASLNSPPSSFCAVLCGPFRAFCGRFVEYSQF